MNETFSAAFPPPGNVAFSSQSGALGLAVLAAAHERGLGLTSFISVGNKVDISGNDLLQYWEADDATQVILLYLESFGNPRKFGRIARRVGRTKPIVAVKAGRTPAGTRAASGHTGALAAGDVAVDALFRQAGVIRTDTLEQLFDVATVLSNQSLPPTNRVAIVTNGGGPGILAADACEANGLDVAPLTGPTVTRLRARLPAQASVVNPVDMIAAASADDYRHTVETVAADPHIDSVIAIFIPPIVTRATDVAHALADASLPAGVSLVSVFMQHGSAGDVLRAARIPVFRFPEDAAAALGRVARYGRWRRRPEGRVVQVDDVDGVTLALDTSHEAARAVEQIARDVEHAGHPELLEAGYVVQEMVAGGVELIAGINDDPMFGHLLLVGLGGSLVELLDDVNVRIHPLTDRDVDEMLTSLHGYPLLTGYRGSDPVDLAAVKRLLFRLSSLAEHVPQTRELDLNPVFARSDGATAVDARIRLARRHDPTSGVGVPDRRHPDPLVARRSTARTTERSTHEGPAVPLLETAARAAGRA